MSGIECPKGSPADRGPALPDQGECCTRCGRNLNGQGVWYVERCRVCWACFDAAASSAVPGWTPGLELASVVLAAIGMVGCVWWFASL